MNPQSKAREFWIHQGKEKGQSFVCTGDETRHFIGLHVIEFEAYRKAVEALKEIAKHRSSYSGESSPEANLAKKTIRELGVE